MVGIGRVLDDHRTTEWLGGLEGTLQTPSPTPAMGWVSPSSRLPRAHPWLAAALRGMSEVCLNLGPAVVTLPSKYQWGAAGCEEQAGPGLFSCTQQCWVRSVPDQLVNLSPKLPFYIFSCKKISKATWQIRITWCFRNSPKPSLRASPSESAPVS